MITRAVSVAVVVACTFAVNTAVALGASGDATKIGDNAKDIVLPNAKAFWWICLVVGVLGMAASRKASRAGGIAIMLLISGVVIYNPAGVASFMQSTANRLL